MTKTARADGRQGVTDPTAAVSSLTSFVRISLSPPKTDCNGRQPLAEFVVYDARVSTLSMPIHDPATLEKFRQAATACRTSRSGQRAKSRSISDATVATATGNGGVGQCVAGQESAPLVPLSASSFGRQATSPSTAESRFFSHNAVDRDADDGKTVDDYERSRRGRGRRRTLAVVTTARWLQQLLPSKTGGRHAATPRSGERPPLSPPAFTVTSDDDESATSDVETNLLRRAPGRQGAATAARDVHEGDNGDPRRSRDTFYSSTTTDQFRLSTGSDCTSARPLSSGAELNSPEVFCFLGDNSDASESCTNTDHDKRRRSFSDTDAFRPPPATSTKDASTGDVSDANRASDSACVDSSLRVPNMRPALRFDLAKSVLFLLLLFVLY